LRQVRAIAILYCETLKLDTTQEAPTSHFCIEKNMFTFVVSAVTDMKVMKKEAGNKLNYKDPCAHMKRSVVIL
jgi:hypothetical protein